MNIIIRETREIRELDITDNRTGCSYVLDFVGNAGALSDGQFKYWRDRDLYIADAETYNWWERVTRHYQEMEDRLQAAREEFGHEAIDDLLAKVGMGHDMEDLPDLINNALDKLEEDRAVFDPYYDIFGREVEDGIALFHKSGEVVTRIPGECGIYPVNSQWGIGFDHPEGIVLSVEMCRILGIKIEK